jgi:hypothetical protein
MFITVSKRHESSKELDKENVTCSAPCSIPCSAHDEKLKLKVEKLK